MIPNISAEHIVKKLFSLVYVIDLRTLCTFPHACYYLCFFLHFPHQLIWRISTEILHHHPNSKMEDYNNIYERMKHSGFKNYLMV